MEFSNRPEFDAGGPYIVPPDEEHAAPGPEFTPPGPEIQPPGEEFPPDEKNCPESPPRKHSKRLIAAFLVLLGLFAAGRDNAPPPAAPSASAPTETEAILSTEPGHAAEPATEATAPPATEATAPPAFYPIHLRVYGGYLANDGEAVLLDANLDPGTVSELSIPQPEPQPGYRFLGYGLVHRDRTENWISRTVSESLDLSSLQSCKPDENGIIQVTLWGTWIADGGESSFLPLTLDANGGEGTQTYDAASPRLSGTNVYLSPFPVPARPGWRFTGWYREPTGGEPVLTLQAPDFYDRIDGQTDWRSQKPITLYAHWEKLEP